ncbi:hypothetical protein DINM_002316 [Dirofilaria immitis]|nr:hypothetical protein [Dirofilaria immitis]
MQSNKQEMIPQSRRNFNVSRTKTLMKSNRDGPFRSLCTLPMFPQSTVVSSSYSSLCYRSLYQHQKRPNCHLSTPIYSVSNFTNAQHFPAWRGPPKAYSPHIYKNPQNMIKGCSDFSITSDSRRDSCKNSEAIEQFDVNEYVIPSMTVNPWAKLEELYINRQLDEQ